MKTLIGLLSAVAMLLVLAMPVAAHTSATPDIGGDTASDNDDRFVICHATSSEENPYELLTLPAPPVFNEESGHFNEDGTTQAGHEEDFFFFDRFAELTDDSDCADVPVTPPAPTTTPATCEAPGTLVIPEGVEGVTYVVDPEYTAGDTGEFTITVEFDPGYALAAGADAEWTLTVEEQLVNCGSITIMKDASPDGAQDFAFTTTGTGLSGFWLDDDADATLSNQKAFTGLVAGTYTVTEGTTAGWDLTSIVCHGAGVTRDTTTRTATIQLATNADVTCWFVNTKQGTPVVPCTCPVVTPPAPPKLSDTAVPMELAGSLGGLLVLLSGIGISATRRRDS